MRCPGLLEVSNTLAFDQILFLYTHTAAADNLLWMYFWSSQWKFVSYLRKQIKNKREKISWRPFWIYQLISTANPALFKWNWAWLAVLISWWIPEWPPGFFFLFFVLILIWSFKCIIIGHWVLTFFMRNKLSTPAVKAEVQNI